MPKVGKKAGGAMGAGSGLPAILRRICLRRMPDPPLNHHANRPSRDVSLRERSHATKIPPGPARRVGTFCPCVLGQFCFEPSPPPVLL
jgi:hypothetical protein